MYKLSHRSYNNLNGVKAIYIGILTEAIKESPYDFGIPKSGGFRTSDYQHSMYSIGRTVEKDKKTITNCDGYNKKSYHQSGNAFDVFGYVNGKGNWDESVLTAIAKHIINVAKVKFNIKLEWGGLWDDPDMPHFQGK